MINWNYNVGTITNYLQVSNNTTGNAPSIQFTGSDSNVGAVFSTKGTGVYTFENGAGNVIFNTSNIASAVNYLNFQPAATNNPPALSAAGSDSNINLSLAVKGTGVLNFICPTLANYITATPAATTASPALSAVGSDTNIILTVKGQGTGGTAIQGTTAAVAANAPAGYVGELQESTNATAVAMTTATVTQIQTLSLTVGDWDVWATFYTAVGGSTVSSEITCQLHTSTATIAAPTTAELSSIQSNNGTALTGVASYLSTGQSRWNVPTAGVTVYLNASATYSVSTLTGNGMIHARRVR
jgi:hypothetical protein